MSHISSTTQTPIYDQVSNLEKFHGDKELKLTSDGTVATKMFGSDSRMGNITAFFGKLLGYDDGTKLKEQFLEEFKKTLNARIDNNTIGLDEKTKTDLQNRVNSFNLDQPTGASKLTAKTLMTFAAPKQNYISAKTLNSNIKLYQTRVRIALFKRALKGENIDTQDLNLLEMNDQDLIKHQKTTDIKKIVQTHDKECESIKNGVSFLEEVLENTNKIKSIVSDQKVRKGNVNYQFLKKYDSKLTINIKQFLNIKLSGTEWKQDDPQKYIQDKRTELENRLSALDTTSTSGASDVMNSQTTAPVSSNQNTTPDREQTVEQQDVQREGAITESEAPQSDNTQKTLDQLATLILESLSNRTPEKALKYITNLERNPKIQDTKNSKLALGFIRSMRTTETKNNAEINSNLKNMIGDINNAKTNHDNEESKKVFSSKVAFSEADALTVVKKYF